jgi:hypothetical protein
MLYAFSLPTKEHVEGVELHSLVVCSEMKDGEQGLPEEVQPSGNRQFNFGFQVVVMTPAAVAESDGGDRVQFQPGWRRR